jgi:serine/threonine protein phosphatase 1
MITVAIGDVHGMHKLLKKLLREIASCVNRHPNMKAYKLIFLGDLIDRGPKSRQVVRRVRQLEGEGAICLRGNHEDLMVRYLADPCASQTFLMHGGAETLRSYKGYKEEFDDDRRWMSFLPTSYEDQLRIFVHAGIKPGRSLADQEDYTKMWIRKEFLDFPGQFPKYVVHGHTPTYEETYSHVPVISDNRCNLDTGSCFGGSLSAAFFNDIGPKPFHIISVK